MNISLASHVAEVSVYYFSSRKRQMLENTMCSRSLQHTLVREIGR